MASRCWPGYEPVPGKAKHDQGSCRKKPKSRTSARGKKVQRARRAQLDRWKKAHPRSRKSAAQGLRAPKSAGRKAPRRTRSKKGRAKKTRTAKRRSASR